MKYKILAIDLDGTLLTLSKNISEADLNSINRYLKNGGIPVVVTGRSASSGLKHAKIIEDYCQQRLPFFCGFKGAYIFDHLNDQVYEWTLNNDECKIIYDLSEKFRLTFWGYTKAGFKDDYITIRGYHLKWVSALVSGSKFKKIHAYIPMEAYKINFLSLKKTKIKKLYQYLYDNGYDKIFDISYTSKFLLEINKKGVNKASALKFIGEKMQIAADNIAAIGDSFNDVPMFEFANLSIAIKPKNKKVIPSANHIINHKKDGVSDAIFSYIFDAKNDICPQIKALVCDLDGTLLDNVTKQVDPAVKLSIHRLGDYNFPLIIASGRPVNDGIEIYKDLQLPNNSYIIGGNGALIYDLYQKKYVKISPIEFNLAKKIFNFLNDLVKTHPDELGFTIYDHTQSLAVVNNDFVNRELARRNPSPANNSWDRKSVYEISSFDEVATVVKFVITFKNALFFKQVEKLIKEQKFEIELTSANQFNLEINAQGINKGFGVKHIANLMQIPVANIMTVGDSYNDISMFKVTKYSATLKSAEKPVRESALFVLDQKESLVVKKVIENIIFIP